MKNNKAKLAAIMASILVFTSGCSIKGKDDQLGEIKDVGGDIAQNESQREDENTSNSDSIQSPEEIKLVKYIESHEEGETNIASIGIEGKFFYYVDEGGNSYTWTYKEVNDNIYQIVNFNKADFEKNSGKKYVSYQNVFEGGDVFFTLKDDVVTLSLPSKTERTFYRSEQETQTTPLDDPTQQAGPKPIEEDLDKEVSNEKEVEDKE